MEIRLLIRFNPFEEFEDRQQICALLLKRSAHISVLFAGPTCSGSLDAPVRGWRKAHRSSLAERSRSGLGRALYLGVPRRAHRVRREGVLGRHFTISNQTAPLKVRRVNATGMGNSLKLCKF